MAVIAGHRFEGGPLGNLCVNEKTDSNGNKYICNKSLVEILGVTRDDINKHGYACQAHLTESEYKEIEAEKERIWSTLKHPG